MVLEGSGLQGFMSKSLGLKLGASRGSQDSSNPRADVGFVERPGILFSTISCLF